MRLTNSHGLGWNDSMLIPSLLEYSIESLNKKLDLLSDPESKLTVLQDGSHLSLHLDFVMESFAKDRSIMKSLGFATTISTLITKFKDAPLNISVHLMGETEDILQAFEYFEMMHIPMTWKLTLFVPEKFTNSWKHSVHEHDAQGKVEIGVWYDLGVWERLTELPINVNQFLIMTVFAGKSGQSRNDEYKQRAIDYALKYPDKHFIFDGGWKVLEADQTPQNADIISYRDYWGEM
jgi:pentose-5-phosphate-3-epimerase